VLSHSQNLGLQDLDQHVFLQARLIGIFYPLLQIDVHLADLVEIVPLHVQFQVIYGCMSERYQYGQDTNREIEFPIGALGQDIGGHQKGYDGDGQRCQTYRDEQGVVPDAVIDYALTTISGLLVHVLEEVIDYLHGRI